MRVTTRELLLERELPLSRELPLERQQYPRFSKKTSPIDQRERAIQHRQSLEQRWSRYYKELHSREKN